MNMQQSLIKYDIITEKNISLEPAKVTKRIKQANWKLMPFKQQNWGNWLHRMSPYVGKIKPGMAHFLIKAASNESDIILDPFCGVGTIPLEADLLGRIGIGIDLNPYAYAITRAKFDRDDIKEHLSWLDSLELDTSKIDLSKCSSFMKKFYHPKTLKEILALQQILIKEKKHFLYGCLLGIIHGHRIGHLSAVTSLVIPYDPRTKPEYREVIPRMKDKVRRMYRDGFKLKTKSKAYLADARNIPLRSNSVDSVISSPPYFNTLDYVADNRLRLEFLGLDNQTKEKLKTLLIQDRANYLDEMNKVGLELRRVLKPDGFCIFVLGDLHSGKKIINTADEIRKIYENIGFMFHELINDAMPTNKCVPSSFKRNKFDRILILSNNK